VAARRLTASVSVSVLALVGCACSSASSADPSTTHTRPSATGHVSATTAPPPTTTDPAGSGPPSAVPTTVPVPQTQPPGWTAALTSLPPGGGFTSLSCISDTFCVAVGGGSNGDSGALTSGSGVAVSWDGAAWSDPTVYYPAPASGPVTAPVLPAVACTSGPICVIVDGSGHVSAGDGTHWGPLVAMAQPSALPLNAADPGPGHAGSRAVAISCPSPTTCTFVGDTGQAYTWRDSAWLAPQAFGTPAASGSAVSLYQAGRVGVSCPTTSSCTAVVGASVLDWNGSEWTREALPWTSTLVSGPTDPTAIACPSPTQCVIVNGTGVSIRTGSGGWSAEQSIDPHGGLDSVACPTTSFCLAADEDGSVVSWNGSAWSTPDQVLPAATEYPGLGSTVSCPNDQFCMVMNGDGDYTTYTGPSSGPT
jgi:hypothetical protein